VSAGHTRCPAGAPHKEATTDAEVSMFEHEIMERRSSGSQWRRCGMSYHLIKSIITRIALSPPYTWRVRRNSYVCVLISYAPRVGRAMAGLTRNCLYHNVWCVQSRMSNRLSFVSGQRLNGTMADHNASRRQQLAHVRCRCDCGNEFTASYQNESSTTSTPAVVGAVCVLHVPEGVRFPKRC